MLLAGMAALLSVLLGGIIVLIRLQQRHAAFRHRVAAMTLHAGPRPAVARPALVRANVNQGRPLLQRLAGVIGFDTNRRDQYAVPWFVVLGASLLMARVIVMLAIGIVGPVAWLLMPLAGVIGCHFYYARANGNRRGLLLEQFPDALALIVRAVRVGIPVTESLRAVAREAPAPTNGEFDLLHQALAIGVPLETALRDMALRNQLAEYSFFAAALALQAQTGGGLTDTLEGLADIIRRRIAMKERGYALSSEARTSSLVLGALPVVVGSAIWLISPDYIGLLFTDPLGRTLLGGAVLSLATGMAAMRLIIRQTLS